MSRSPDSLIPSVGGQLPIEKRDDKASIRRRRGKANSRAATHVNAVAASTTPPTSKPAQLELIPGRACVPKAKPAINQRTASPNLIDRDGVEGGGTRGEHIKTTGETQRGLATEHASASREAYKGDPRKRRPEAPLGVGGGHSTGEPSENDGEGRTATSITRTEKGKAAGLPPRGSAPSRSKPLTRLDKARKLQRTLYRTAKRQPERRFTSLYDKIIQPDILQEAWQRVKANRGAAGVDQVTIEAIEQQGIAEFLAELEQALRQNTYRVSNVRRVYIPKAGQPQQKRPLGIPTVKDRVVQMAVKIVIEPLFEADFLPCSYGFRPQRTPRMALNVLAEKLQMGYEYVVDVDLKSYFDTINHDLLMRLVERRVGDQRVLRLLRAWLKAGVLEEGKVTHSLRGSPQGGVISPLLSNIMLHEIDRQWSLVDEALAASVILVRYADDMVLLARTASNAQAAWNRLQGQFTALRLEVNQEKSRLTTVQEGFAFLGFEFRKETGRPLYMWPRKKACQHLRQRMREVVRSVPSNQSLGVVIQKLNPVLNGWCTYFRVGNSNRVFHQLDWAVRSEVQLWLRRKHRCEWQTAKRHWNYRRLHERCRLYRMVGKVSHLEGLRRKQTEEDGRRAGCGKSARPVR
jgi:RNA-directed DNA polymerase